MERGITGVSGEGGFVKNLTKLAPGRWRSQIVYKLRLDKPRKIW
jgi:hypothetical protein